MTNLTLIALITSNAALHLWRQPKSLVPCLSVYCKVTGPCCTVYKTNKYFDNASVLHISVFAVEFCLKCDTRLWVILGYRCDLMVHSQCSVVTHIQFIYGGAALRWTCALHELHTVKWWCFCTGLQMAD